MRCKGILKTYNLGEQCSHRAKIGNFCAKHSEISKATSLKDAFDRCFHALKTIEELNTDPTEESYLIAKQALNYFEESSN